MPRKRVLSRLVRLRELEEEQGRLSLEDAVRRRGRVCEEMDHAKKETEMGRMSFLNGVARRDALGRTGGLIGMEIGVRECARVAPRLQGADREVELQREEFLRRRTARMQVESLATEARNLAEAEVAQRAQQILDDWYGRRRRLSDASNSQAKNGDVVLKGEEPEENVQEKRGGVAGAAEDQQVSRLRSAQSQGKPTGSSGDSHPEAGSGSETC